jgi:hypothetical protein
LEENWYGLVGRITQADLKMAKGKIFEYVKARNFLINMLKHMSVSERMPSAAGDLDHCEENPAFHSRSLASEPEIRGTAAPD